MGEVSYRSEEKIVRQSTEESPLACSHHGQLESAASIASSDGSPGSSKWR